MAEITKKDMFDTCNFCGDKNEGIKDYFLEKEGNGFKPVFRDKTGRIVDVGSARARETDRKVEKSIVFDSETQRQFAPNHIMTGIEIYNFILDSMEFNFPDMVTGYSATGDPILDTKKVNEVKDGIEKAIRYCFSTWGGIDYGKRIVSWEKDYDSNGKPVSFRPVETTILESMFGPDVLKFIKKETKDSGLEDLNRPREDSKRHVIEVNGVGKIDLSTTSGDDFKIAVWKGVFTFLVAKEIQNHRSFTTNLKRYNYAEIARAYSALIGGEFINFRELTNVKADTISPEGVVFYPELGTLLATYGLIGLLKFLRQAIPQIFK